MVDPDELIVAKELIRNEFSRIYSWAIGDIRKCCRLKKDGTYKKGPGSLIGAFILWCCAVDYYGGLLVGIKKYRNWEGEIVRENYSTKQHVREFVTKYLKKYGDYDPERVYKLRNSLVHNYTLDGYTVVEHDPIKKSDHLKQTSKGYYLHLGCAIDDLERAARDYMQDVKNNEQLTINAYEYYKLNPMLLPSTDS